VRRLIAWPVVALCVIGVGVLLFKSPSAFFEETGDTQGVHVSCSPVIRVGWPSDFSGLQPKDDWDHFSDHVEEDTSLTLTQRQGIAQDCDERRTTYLAFISILVLIAGFGSAAALRQPARREPDSG
jgi:hypothetical protein